MDRGAIQPAPPARVEAELTVELVLLRDSGWHKHELAPLVESLAAILGQCEVWVRRVNWVELAVPPGWLDYSSASASELIAAFPVRRPAAFLVRDTRNVPAFDAEAIGRGNSRTRPLLRDTVWLTRALPHPSIGLAHVLMNSGAHDDRPGNLMRDRSDPGHRRLAADQCQRLLAKGRYHGLLTDPP